MGSIKSIKLQNFQSHKESKIAFDDGLTVILGQTDQGKSAIIRALKWVLYNEPRGTDFITAGCNLCRVTIEMEDGSVIIRERDGQKNRYILRQDGSEQIFEGFGYKVPLEIIKAHGIPKIYIDKDSTSAVNLAEQLEPPFLISESGSTRAKALGRLVGIHIIDAAQRTTLKDLIDAEQRSKLLDKDITDLKEDLKEYKDIEILAEKLTSLKHILKNLKQKKFCLSKLIQIKQNLDSINYEISNNLNVLSKVNFIDKVEKYILLIDRMHSKYNYLNDYRNKLNNVSHSIETEKEIIIKTKNLKTVEQYYSTVIKLNKKSSKITTVKNDLKNNDINLEHTVKIMNNTEKVFRAADISIEIEKLLDIVKKYITVNGRWKSINRKINIQKKDLERYSKIDKVEDYFKNLSKKIQELSAIVRINNSLVTVEKSIRKGEDYFRKVLDNINIMANEYSLLLKKFSKCPTCLSEIDEKTTQRIIMEMSSYKEVN